MYPDEGTYFGEFTNGKRWRKGIWTTADGTITKGTWKNDEFKEDNLKGNKPNKTEIIKRLNIFREMNPKISKYIYSNCAAKFQSRDSEIARSIIKKCMYQLVPVLGNY